jgi:hypothetical protein
MSSISRIICMRKVLIADLIKQVKEEMGLIDLLPVGFARYEHNPEHDVYIVTLTLDKGGEKLEYVLDPNGLKDLKELGIKYFYNEMESPTFGMTKADE